MGNWSGAQREKPRRLVGNWWIKYDVADKNGIRILLFITVEAVWVKPETLSKCASPHKR